MKLAALDLGSNTFLQLIVEVMDAGDKNAQRSLQVLSDEVRMVRLGEGLQQSGLISNAALERAEAAMSEFARIRSQFSHIDRVVAVATAAARKSANSLKLVELGRKYGCEIQIVSGEAEARLSYLGALSGLGLQQELQSQDVESFLVVDIGGASSEVILGDRYNPKILQSIPLGVLEVAAELENFGVDQVAARTWVESKIEKSIHEELFPALAGCSSLTAVAVAGTPTEIARISLDPLADFRASRLDGFVLDRKRLSFWISELMGMSSAEVVRKYRVDPRRADILCAGCFLLEGILLNLDLEGFRVSTRGVRYGVAIREIESGGHFESKP